jgi:predicted nucleic acid-binding protein
MVNSIFLDVNVCLDFLLKREPFASAAGRIFESIEHQQTTAFVSAISFDTMFYVLRPAVGGPKATSLLDNLTNKIHIAAADKHVIKSAINAGWKDLEDAIQYQSARVAGCQAIITRNEKDFKQAELPVLSPQGFLDQLKE